MLSWPSERIGVCAVVVPQSANNTTKDTGGIDLSKFHAAMFVLQLGTIDAVIDFKLQESADDVTYTDLTGKSITQLTGTDDNKQAVIAVRSDELSAGKRYVRARATLGNGVAQLVAVLGLGVEPRYGPATDDDLATVAQVVT
jgi:hypothetical protein